MSVLITVYEFEGNEIMKISSILNESLVKVNLEGETKEKVINNIIDLVKNSDKVKDIEKVREAVFERERIMTTGVGDGFAIPHGKTDAITEMVAAFAVTKNPIEYETLDGKPVRLLFLLVGKDSLVGPHIKLLSRISRLMSKPEFRERLLNAKNEQEILKAFREEELNYLEV